ncbi:MAG: carbamoyl phosphate synthase small subunit [Oscillospiraceae bacterium]|nr:carbamoyl phosphate synthase small subunit [Oscillospiraceae bacterium]
MEKAYLVLGNGRIFEGQRIGAAGDGVGELVFTTGTVGYLETLTDPSYAGQIVLQTFPQIGNYGVIPADFEGRCAARGYVVRELCDTPSNFRSEYALDLFLKQQGVPGICGVDTRELTRILREEGVMNALICDAVPEDRSVLSGSTVTGAVASVSVKETSVHPPQGEAKYAVTLIDYGAKGNIIRCLQKRGCTVTVVPHDTAAEDILAAQPDGVMLSNGPGDPAENVFEIAQIAKLVGKVPLFGICLGHQLTALALGGQTVKLKYGHRGANQPVREVGGTRTYITTQNHGYAVLSESLAGVGSELYVNANDGSCEGMAYPGLRCFTVQFHPEACAGPQDMDFLFDRFVAMMGGAHNA